MTLYCGWDLHKKYSQIAVMDSEGKILKNQRVDHQPLELLQEVFQDLEEKPVVAIEATSNWYWMYELLESLGAEVKLVHPKKAKAIASAKVKTDKLDAQVLAHLLRANLLPESYIPPHAIRDLREELRYRAALVMTRTTIKSRVRHLLGRLGIDIPSQTLWKPTGRQTVNAMNLPDPFCKAWRGYCSVLDALDQEIAKAEKALLRKEHKERGEVKLLTTIPGVGLLSALFLLSEIGDIRRFREAKQFCSYCGLTPSVHSSGESHYTGHITKQGSKWLRWILVEDATIAVRCAGPLQEMYLRLKRKKGHPIAVVACARKLAKYIFHMLKKNKTWEENLKIIYGGSARAARMVFKSMTEKLNGQP